VSAFQPQLSCRRALRTNEEHEAFGWSFDSLCPLHSKRTHARDNGTDKIDIKD
jgi:hypothetical protein